MKFSTAIILMAGAVAAAPAASIHEARDASDVLGQVVKMIEGLQRQPEAVFAGEDNTIGTKLGGSLGGVPGGSGISNGLGQANGGAIIPVTKRQPAPSKADSDRIPGNGVTGGLPSNTRKGSGISIKERQVLAPGPVKGPAKGPIAPLPLPIPAPVPVVDRPRPVKGAIEATEAGDVVGVFDGGRGPKVINAGSNSIAKGSTGPIAAGAADAASTFGLAGAGVL